MERVRFGMVWSGDPSLVLGRYAVGSCVGTVLPVSL